MGRACNPSYSGGWGRRIAWTQEAEIVPLHSSLGNKSETPSQKKKEYGKSTYWYPLITSKLRKLMNIDWDDDHGGGWMDAGG